MMIFVPQKKAYTLAVEMDKNRSSKPFRYSCQGFVARSSRKPNSIEKKTKKYDNAIIGDKGKNRIEENR